MLQIDLGGAESAFFTEVQSNVSEPNDEFTGPTVGKTIVNVVRITLVQSLRSYSRLCHVFVAMQMYAWEGVQRGVDQAVSRLSGSIAEDIRVRLSLVIKTDKRGTLISSAVASDGTVVGCCLLFLLIFFCK